MDHILHFLLWLQDALDTLQIIKVVNSSLSSDKVDFPTCEKMPNSVQNLQKKIVHKSHICQ